MTVGARFDEKLRCSDGSGKPIIPAFAQRIEESSDLRRVPRGILTVFFEKRGQ